MNPKSVRQLITILKEDLDLDKEEILASVLKLQGEGKINLEYKTLESNSFTSYLKNTETIWFWIIVAIEVITAIMIFTISEDYYPWIYLRNFLGVVFVLFLPGYSFSRTFFPKNISNKISERELEKIEQIALSIGMSLAIVSIIGLLLYYSPWGIGLNTVVYSLLAFTLVFTTIAVTREYQIKKLS